MTIYTCEIQNNHKSTDTDLLIQRFFSVRFPQTPCPEIMRTPLGKPYFKNSDVHIGVTHTEKRIFIGFHKENFGIDAEKNTRKVHRTKQIAKKYFSAQENLYIFEKPELENIRFLEIWVKKEALVKYTGKGLGALSTSDVFCCNAAFSSAKYKDFTLYICSQAKEQLQIVQS